jgi:hypothetical protein
MPTLLHAACGPATLTDIPIANFKDWDEVRLDIDDRYDPDIVGNICDWTGWRDRAGGGFPFGEREKDGFDAVYCSHALEHLHLFDISKALTSFRTVITRTGFVCVFVPNFQAACRWIAEGKTERMYDAPCGPIYAHDVVFGHSGMTYGNPHMQHRSGLTPELLRGLLLGAGFVVTDVRVDDLNIFMTGQKL